MLRGEALREEAGGEEMLRSFPAAALSADPAARFSALFAARPRWELSDLEPYLSDLQVRTCSRHLPHVCFSAARLPSCFAFFLGVKLRKFHRPDEIEVAVLKSPSGNACMRQCPCHMCITLQHF